MYLAVRELRRAWVRFGILAVAIAMLIFLILFQQTIQTGLITSFTGAIRAQSAPVLVFSVDGQRSLQGSIITPDVEAAVSKVDGVGDLGHLGMATLTVKASDEIATISLFGYSDPDLGGPTELSAGRLPDGDREGVAIATAPEPGFGLGDTIYVQPGGYDITIVGLAENINYQAATTVFTSFESYEASVRSANPGAKGVLPSALSVIPSSGFDENEVITRINSEVDGADAATRDQAATTTPGVAEVQRSFQLIFALYGLVVPLVTGLFFLIMTLQKAESLTLLRAIGAPSRWLISSILIEVVIVVVAGLLLGTLAYLPLSSQNLGGIQLSFQGSAVVAWSAVLFVLALASAYFSARRVLRIDPLQATTGAGVEL